MRSGTAARRRRHGAGFGLVLLVIAGVVLAWSGFTFLATVVATIDIAIEPEQAAPPPAGAGSALPQGERVDVVGTSPTTAFTVHHGKPHKDTGRQLFRVQVDPTRSHQLSATFAWLNPGDGPFQNGFIEAGLYYQILCSGVTSDDVILEESTVTFDELAEGDSDLCFRAATNVDLLTQEVLSTRLVANGQATNRNYLYLIASILNAGHSAPPGQQPDLGSLKFLLITR